MSENFPNQLNFGYNEGRALDCLIGNEFTALPATIPSDRVSSGIGYETIKGPSLWIRSADKKSIIPFCFGGKTTTGTSSTTVVFDTVGAARHFRVGDQVTFFDVSANAFSAVNTTVASIDSDTQITTTAALTSLGTGGDLVFVASGVGIGITTSGSADIATYSENACVVLEDVILTRGIEQGTKAYIQGTFVKSKVKGLYHTVSGTDYRIFNPVNNSSLHFVDIIT